MVEGKPLVALEAIAKMQAVEIRSCLIIGIHKQKGLGYNKNSQDLFTYKVGCGGWDLRLI